MRGAVMVSLCLAIGAPAAACPMALEAARAGVEVTYDDDAVATFVLEEGGITRELTLYVGPGDPDGDGYVVRALHGLYFLEDLALEGGALLPEYSEVITFAAPLDELPAPEPGLRWSGWAMVALGDDAPFPREVSLSVGAAEALMIGDCRYESWPVLLRHRDEIEDLLRGMAYLPELGIALVQVLGDYGGAADVFTPLSIVPAAP